MTVFLSTRHTAAMRPFEAIDEILIMMWRAEVVPTTYWNGAYLHCVSPRGYIDTHIGIVELSEWAYRTRIVPEHAVSIGCGGKSKSGLSVPTWRRASLVTFVPMSKTSGFCNCLYKVYVSCTGEITIFLPRPLVWCPSHSIAVSSFPVCPGSVLTISCSRLPGRYRRWNSPENRRVQSRWYCLGASRNGFRVDHGSRCWIFLFRSAEVKSLS